MCLSASRVRTWMCESCVSTATVVFNVALCSTFRVCCLWDALMLPLHFGRCLNSFCWLKRAGRYAATCWYTPIVSRTSCCWCLFITPVTSSKSAMRWSNSSHLEMGPSAKWHRSTSKSWRASMFIVCRGHIMRDASWKIQLGRVCAALMILSCILGDSWCSCHVSFGARNVGTWFSIVK